MLPRRHAPPDQGAAGGRAHALSGVAAGPRAQRGARLQRTHRRGPLRRRGARRLRSRRAPRLSGRAPSHPHPGRHLHRQHQRRLLRRTLPDPGGQRRAPGSLLAGGHAPRRRHLLDALRLHAGRAHRRHRRPGQPHPRAVGPQRLLLPPGAARAHLADADARRPGLAAALRRLPLRVLRAGQPGGQARLEAPAPEDPDHAVGPTAWSGPAS